MSLDLAIVGGSVVTPEGVATADVGVAGGRIAAVGELPAGAAREVVDAFGCMVLPGVVDTHVHMSILPAAGDDEAQLELIERDLATESAAAARGGVTTFLPMINLAGPYLPHLDRLRRRIAEASHVDAGLTAVLSSADHVAEIPALAAAGIAGFKHFLNAYRRDTAIGALLPISERDFLASLRAIAAVESPAVAMVHAEDVDLIEALEGERRAAGGAADLRALAEARPPICETIRMEYAARAATYLGAPVYFCHCSCIDSLDAMRPRVAAGEDVALEAVTHSLTSTYDAWESVGGWGKFSPPLRGAAHRDALWEGLRDGSIRHVASDHCTWTRAEKENGVGQFGSVWETMPGIANGMEHLLPALVTYGIRTGRITWPELVAVTSANNARRFGYYPRKGTLREGADADVVVLDPERATVVDESFYSGRGRDWSLYWGESLYGKPHVTVARGQVVQRDGELLDRAEPAEFVDARR